MGNLVQLGKRMMDKLLPTNFTKRLMVKTKKKEANLPLVAFLFDVAKKREAVEAIGVADLNSKIYFLS